MSLAFDPSDDEDLAALAVEPPPQLVENCRFCERLLVPPRMVEVMARSSMSHVRAYSCDECVVQYDLVEAIEEAQLIIDREQRCLTEGHWPKTYPQWQIDYHRSGTQPLHCLLCGAFREDLLTNNKEPKQ